VQKKTIILNKNEKEKLKVYVRRLKLILNTELSAQNEMQAIGSLAVTVLRYSYIESYQY
jgi:hypothetical protein